MLPKVDMYQSVAKLVVKALLHPEISRNRSLRVNSFITTPEDILSEFERQCGGEKWSVTYTSLADLRQMEKEAWKNGDSMAPIFSLRRIWTEGGTSIESRDNDAIDGNDMECLADAVRDAIKVQKSAEGDLYNTRKFM